jgi:nitrite reductase/ring-hydroxylating ferredoxin subunit/uncharacterized membrane protein
MSGAMPAPSPAPHAAIEQIGRVEQLDQPAKTIGKFVRDTVPRGAVKDGLSGTWLGHALHPLLTDVPIGTWTSALLLDLVGGRSAQPAARRLIGIGLLAAGPTAVTGWNDWADTEPASDRVRRIGLVHATSNITGVAFYAASWAARRRGGGKLLGLAGFTSLMAGGWLGGHLSYALGVGVDETAKLVGPEEWTRSELRDEDVAEGAMRCTLVDGVPVMVARQNGALHALVNKCAHRGGPLHEGELGDGTVTCPLHGSVFRLEDGAVCRGPSAYPQPAYDVRAVDGVLELRVRAE